MLRKSLASLAGSLGRLGLCDLGGVRQQGAALEQRASRTLVSLRSFCSRGSLQNVGGAASRAGAPDSSLSTAAAGGGGGRRQLSTSAARLQQQQAGAPQPGAAQRPAGEESLDQIRARVFGYHVGELVVAAAVVGTCGAAGRSAAAADWSLFHIPASARGAAPVLQHPPRPPTPQWPSGVLRRHELRHAASLPRCRCAYACRQWAAQWAQGAAGRAAGATRDGVVPR